MFSFSIGGLFRGHSSFEIHGDGDACSHHHYKPLHANPEEHLGTLDKAQVDKPVAFLRDLGARDRFSSYYSPVLDGKRWQLFDGRRSYEWSNAYPKGFEKLPEISGGLIRLRGDATAARRYLRWPDRIGMPRDAGLLRPAKRRRSQAKARERHLRTLDKEASRAFVDPSKTRAFPPARFHASPVAGAGRLSAYARHGTRPQAARPLRNNRLVISAKVCERVHDGYHLAAEFGEAILDAGRILAIVMAKDQPVILHLP